MVDNLFANIPAPEGDEVAPPTELDMLKARAKIMGITHSPNIGLEALKAKVQAKLDGEKAPEPEVGEVDEVEEEAPVVPAPRKKTLRETLWEEQMKLVRVRITNLDPKKKDLPGEIFTVANEYLGTVSKYIPYGEVTDNGYHIPFVLFTALQERQFLNVRTRKGKGGTPIVETQYVREFALEVLPPLTQAELAALAAAQAARQDSDD